MTDNDIIKANEFCSLIPMNCKECSYWGKEDCVKVMTTDTLDLINRQKAEIDECHKQLDEFKFLQGRVDKIKNTPKDTFTGTLLTIAEGVGFQEAVKEFEERAIKKVCEKVYAPTPVQSCIVKKCSQVIIETAKEMVGEG